MRRKGIAIILLLSAGLHFARLGQEGLANLYYAAGVKSMLMNWHNFFFVAFDPGGFITLDKPPVGFWLQAVSAKIFGFEGWSLILPQALAGVASVYLIYVVVKRYHGEGTGLSAALVLALTPIFVAASRNNTIDGLLVLVLLFSVLVFLPAAEELSLKKLLLAFFLIGVGFHIKSLEAYMILPAFYVTYFFTCSGNFKKKVGHLAVGTLVLIAASLPWFIAVDSVAPENRPYVGSSETNSELDLAIGYNGLGHFLGYGIRVPGRSGQTRNFTDGAPQGGSVPAQAPGSGQPPAGISPGGQQMTPALVAMRLTGGETGQPGLFRLFNRQLGGQISWLLPLALMGIVLSLFQLYQRTLPEKSRMKLLFWSFWLIPQMIFFSVAQGAHRYYLVMMAPAIAALAAICFSTLAEWSRGEGKRRFALPAALLVSAGVQVWIVAGYDEWRSWMLPAVAGTGLAAALALGWLGANSGARARWSRTAVAAAVVSILLAPAAWSLTPMLYGSGNATFPFAGPDLNPESRAANTPGAMLNFLARTPGIDTGKLESFLVSHRDGEKYIAAVSSARIAAPLILDTGLPVMTYGGFMGAEKILTAAKLAELVADRQVRYVLIAAGNSQQPELDEWVRSHGTPVPDSEWRAPETAAPAPDGTGAVLRRMTPQRLYDCRL